MILQRWLLALAALAVVSDPSFPFMAMIGEHWDYLAATVLALAVQPWVVEQLS